MMNAGKLIVWVKVDGAVGWLVKVKVNKSFEEVELDGVKFVDENGWHGASYWNNTFRQTDENILKLSSNNFGVFLDKFFVSGMQRDGSLTIHNLDGTINKKLFLHSGLTLSITTSSKYIFSSGLGNSLKAWNSEEKKSYFGHSSPAIQLQVQETLQILFSLNIQGILLIHDIRTEETLRKVDSTNKIKSFASSPQGIIAICYSNTNQVIACSLNGCEEWVVEGIYESILLMKFDSTGEVLVCGTRESVIVKEVFTNSMIRKKIESCVKDLEIFKEANWLGVVFEKEGVTRVCFAFNE